MQFGREPQCEGADHAGEQRGLVGGRLEEDVTALVNERTMLPFVDAVEDGDGAGGGRRSVLATGTDERLAFLPCRTVWQLRRPGEGMGGVEEGTYPRAFRSNVTDVGEVDGLASNDRASRQAL